MKDWPGCLIAALVAWLAIASIVAGYFWGDLLVSGP